MSFRQRQTTQDRGDTFTSVHDGIGAIRILIDAYSKRCEPFTWTKKATAPSGV